jgi:hypothetical protein
MHARAGGTEQGSIAEHRERIRRKASPAEMAMSGRYRPCHLCKVEAHPDEMILWSEKKYAPPSRVVNKKWICLWCVELLNKYKGAHLAIKAAAA